LLLPRRRILLYPFAQQNRDELGRQSRVLLGWHQSLCAVWTYFRVPEPKGRTQAEMDMLFEAKVAARKFSDTGVESFDDIVVYDKSSVDKTKSKRTNETYSSRDSHVVTHRSTNLPFNCLCMAERTGCPVFS
ncbi:hypothetical protein KCU67_g17229, partial [Aureobasidium melanogenum]